MLALRALPFQDIRRIDCAERHARPADDPEQTPALRAFAGSRHRVSYHVPSPHYSDHRSSEPSVWGAEARIRQRIFAVLRTASSRDANVAESTPAYLPIC